MSALGRSREVSSRLEAALNAAARARSGSSHGHGGIGDSGGGGGGGDEAEEDTAAYHGPPFELRVFRDVWRCLMLCWDDKVRPSVWGSLLTRFVGLGMVSTAAVFSRHELCLRFLFVGAGLFRAACSICHLCHKLFSPFPIADSASHRRSWRKHTSTCQYEPRYRYGPVTFLQTLYPCLWHP